MSIGVAIIGGGIFAREEHLPAVQASPHLALRAIYSRSLKSAQTLAADASVDLYSEDTDQGKGTGFDALLSRPDIHAVIIALPIPVQPEFIKRAVSAGKHVLSEKPIAKDIATAQDLIAWYETTGRKVIWSVAENARYWGSFAVAAEERAKLGRIVEFRMKRHLLVKGGKYYETSWRKVPEYQGGFLLDGGVHDVACLRLLLHDDHVAKLSAFTRLNQKHLPPVDTIDATLKLKSGATGTLSQSFGTTFPRHSDWSFACEKGTMSIVKNVEIVDGKAVDARGNLVTVLDLDGKVVHEQYINDGGSGVTPEVKAWAEALAAGRQNSSQSPQEALADLELIEKMLQSGEQDATPQTCTLQSV